MRHGRKWYRAIGWGGVAALGVVFAVEWSGGEPRMEEGGTTEAVETAALEHRPQLREELLKREKLAPPEVAREIGRLREGSPAEKVEAARRLAAMGDHAADAVLALMETLRDRRPVFEPSEFGGQLLVRVTPSDEATRALVLMGASIKRVLEEGRCDLDPVVAAACELILREVKGQPQDDGKAGTSEVAP